VEAYAEDINNAGDVVYQWFLNDFKAEGALLNNGTYYKFDHPKSMDTYGAGINDRGVIVGFYTPLSGPGGGFKATY
jgi:hypothetical protein